MDITTILATGKGIIDIAKNLAAHAGIQFNHLTLEHFMGVAVLAWKHHHDKKDKLPPETVVKQVSGKQKE